MKKKYVITILFIMIFLSLPSICLASVNGTVYCPDDNQPVNVRNSAGGNLIGSVACNSQLEVLDTNAGSTSDCSKWYKVRQGILTGYACGTYVKIDSINEVGKALCIENDDPLNIWSDINKSSKLKSLSCNTQMNILEKNVASNSKCSNWYKVEYQGTTGYSCGKYIGDVNSTSPSSPNVGKTTSGDNIYIKENYQSKPSSDGTISCYENTKDASLRSTPGGSSVQSISCGVPVKINSVKESSGSCGYYYNVTDLETNVSGWICGYYVSTTKLSSTAENYYNTKESLDSYYNTLRTAGFPDSYLPYLAEIHARHPNWKFNARKINLTFDEVVAGESYNGRNLLDGRDNNFDSNYFSMDLNTYDILNDTFYDYDTEDGWYNASSEAVAFYLDPRNYLNEKYIFAFEPLFYNSGYTAAQVNQILNQSFWATVYNGDGSKVGTDVITASQDADISAIHIASRIRQEINSITAPDPRLGGTFTYNDTNYSGYYNFYNIGVYGTNKIVNGMVYAMNNGWNTPYNGILGGAKFIREGYIGIGQDTVYYEKFDVQTQDSDNRYRHQFQQNLAVAFQETQTSFNRYVTYDNYLNREISFTIPVYNNMSNYAVTSPRIGNPNNYLKDLKVNGNTVNGFNYDVYNYEITVPAGTSSIDVSANKINSNAIVSGTGNIAIDSNKKTIDIVVTAQNKRTRTYKINVIRLEADEKDVIDINTIMNNSGVKYNNNYIFGIGEKTDSNSFINNIKKISNLNTASIKDKTGNSKTGIFKTGDVVTISNSVDTNNYTVVIYGDINGDGVIDKLDYLAVLRDYYGYSKLSGVYKVAADANHDGKVDKLDYLAVLRNYYGYAKINQG